LTAVPAPDARGAAEAAAPAEIELKLGLDPAAVPALLRHPALVAAKRGAVRRAHLVSAYFDTSDFRLAESGIALRVRRDGSRWVQTVKGPPLATSGGALHARPEYEWAVAGARLEPRHLAATPWRRLFAKTLSTHALARRFTTDFERRSVRLAFADGTRAVLCVDVGEIRAAGRGRARVPIAEVEIELESGRPERLFELARALAADLPLTAIAANKAERGFALARGLPDGWRVPDRARTLVFPARVAAGAALAAIVGECVRQIAANAAGLLADDDPEWIHQMRVGIRRLRSCLALLAPFVPPAEIAPVAADAKWLAGTLGPARDWDVFATETLPPLAKWFVNDPATAPGLRRLRARIGPRRGAAREAARGAVRSPRFTQLLLAAGALAVSPALGASPAEGKPPRARRYAAELLSGRHRKLRRRGAHLAGATPPERHTVRIAAKKMRYAGEFFAPLFAKRQPRPYLQALARLQDALGHYNDAATAARLAAELAGTDTEAATAAGAVCGWAAAQAAALEPELLAAWQAFAATPAFWRRK
jgi:inorganic triphosphatase YgiF